MCGRKRGLGLAHDPGYLRERGSTLRFISVLPFFYVNPRATTDGTRCNGMARNIMFGYDDLPTQLVETSIKINRTFSFDLDIVRIATSLRLSMAQNCDSCQNSETTVPDCGRGEVYLRSYRKVLFRIQK